ncbi:hypothetical protein [Acetatifactor aquisgranensis]|uniref:hypothetical protein n=1 Tax=Acetatifactor aquisgranensis TaxID=2941233 RepID=UPI00203AD74F|nr:hypothetical protein [Acetatifactor aquisgranensis]
MARPHGMSLPAYGDTVVAYGEAVLVYGRAFPGGSVDGVPSPARERLRRSTSKACCGSGENAHVR